jgi:hypothetical protein
MDTKRNQTSGAVFRAWVAPLSKRRMTCKSVYHNRDYNAAFNIGVRFKTLFWPHMYATTNKDSPVGADDVDATLSALSAELFQT